jgi:Carbohydrate-binding family 9
MKRLRVAFQKNLKYADDIKEVSSFLDTIERKSLAFAPWPAYKYKPEVHFSISYTGDCLLLKYYVEEKHIRAHNGEPNAPVYQDSCVELFISFEDGEEYYNVEFNCIGAGRIGFGKEKKRRKLLPRQLISQIKSQVVIAKTEKMTTRWELTLMIPFPVFCYHSFLSLKGLHARANFYKCGDRLPEPHFIAWSTILSAEPNFHLPQYFGTLVFD